MKTNSTILKKLTASLCTILLALFVMSCSAADNNSALSVAKLKECKLMVINSHLLTKSWVYTDKNPDTPDKLALKKLHSVDFPKLRAELTELAKKWEETYFYELEQIFIDINAVLLEHQKYIMRVLNSKAAYEDTLVVMELQEMVEYYGEKGIAGPELDAANDIVARLDALIEIIGK